MRSRKIHYGAPANGTWHPTCGAPAVGRGANVTPLVAYVTCESCKAYMRRCEKGGAS